MQPCAIQFPGWWTTHVPVGFFAVIIGFLGIALPLIQPMDRIRRVTKAVWSLVFAFCLIGELVSLRLDRANREAEEKFTDCENRERFASVSRGVEKNLLEERQLFHKTMLKVQEGIDTQIGTGSFCYLDFLPALNDVRGMELRKVGKYPIYGVHFDIYDETARARIFDSMYKPSADSSKQDTDAMEMMQRTTELTRTRFDIGNLAAPSKFLGGYPLTGGDRQSLTVIFSTFNDRGWIERVEFRKVNGEWQKAIMIEPSAEGHWRLKTIVSPLFPRKDGHLDVLWPRRGDGRNEWDR